MVVRCRQINTTWRDARATTALNNKAVCKLTLRRIGCCVRSAPQKSSIVVCTVLPTDHMQETRRFVPGDRNHSRGDIYPWSCRKVCCALRHSGVGDENEDAARFQDTIKLTHELRAVNTSVRSTGHGVQQRLVHHLRAYCRNKTCDGD